MPSVLGDLLGYVLRACSKFFRRDEFQHAAISHNQTRARCAGAFTRSLAHLRAALADAASDQTDSTVHS